MGSLEKPADMKTFLIFFVWLLALSVAQKQGKPRGCFSCSGSIAKAIFKCRNVKPIVPDAVSCVKKGLKEKCVNCLCSKVCETKNVFAKQLCKALQVSGHCPVN